MNKLRFDLIQYHQLLATLNYYLSAKSATTTNTNDATTVTIGTPTDKSVAAKMAGIIAGISVALVAVIIMGIIYFRRTQENEIRRHTEHER